MGGDNQWHMYNTKLDPGETNDVKAQYPALFKQMLVSYKEYEKAMNIVPVDEQWNPFENVK